MPMLKLVAAALAAGLGSNGLVGGWAVITVENPPEYLEAGTTYVIEYTVRQHGTTLLTGLDGTLLVQPSGTDPVIIEAKPGSSAGHYLATLPVPATEGLRLTIRSGFSGNGWGDLTLLSIPVIRAGSERPSLSTVELGRRLFVAKGCGTCHVNGDVPEFAALNRVVAEAPVLTGRRLAAEYVRQRLTDPSSLPRIGDYPVRMPDLSLAPAEVEALVALVSGAGDRAER